MKQSGSDDLRREAVAAVLASSLEVLLPNGIGTIAAAAAQPALSRLVDYVGSEWTTLRAGRAARVFEVAAIETALSPDQLADQIASSEGLLELAGSAAQAAAGARYGARIAALGRSLANGVADQSDAKIDEEIFFVRAVGALDRPHVRLLDFLHRHEQDEDRAAEDPQFAAVHQLPDLQPVLGSLLSTLERYYLVQRQEELRFREAWKINGTSQVPDGLSGRLKVTDFGREVLRRLVEAGNIHRTESSTA